MMTPERRAVVWCWLAHYYGASADDIRYSWPPPGEDAHERAAELESAADACMARAARLDPSEGLWQRAIARWDCTGEPIE